MVILGLFLSFNRFPKLDVVGSDLEAVSAPEVQCFQGFCIEREDGSTLLERWWVFSITYLRLVAIGMIFAFLVAGLSEAFLFPPGSGTGFSRGGVFRRTIKGLTLGPVMNLCSACITPVSTAFQKRGGGIEGAIAMVQGSATMNIPALAMVFFVFTPMLGFSRLIMALIGALLIGPLVVMVMRKTGCPLPIQPDAPGPPQDQDVSSWRTVLREGSWDWAKSSIGYLVRIGPIMVVAGFASGLVIQWLSPDVVSTYLGNDLTGVALAATFGILINVPLLFEIPLVALLLLLGMGTAPAAALLFTAAAGGPITFWGLANIMPKRAIATFATSTWALGAFGGIVVLGLASLIPQQDTFSAEAFGADNVSNGTSSTPGTSYEVQAVHSLPQGPVFRDATLESGVDFLHHKSEADFVDVGAGVIVLDFNNDGFQDIYITNSEGPNALYRNNGDGTFIDVAVAAGVDDPQSEGNGGCAADYDNDGDMDLYVTNFGFSKLFRNDNGRAFTHATDTGLEDSDRVHRSMGCAWGDYDRDGFLDLIVVRHVHKKNFKQPPDLQELVDALDHLVLYRNNGDGTFANVTALLGDPEDPTNAGPCSLITPSSLPGRRESVGNIWGAGFQPGWMDFDNDGDLDLYVVNDFGAAVRPNVLWRNDGQGADGKWIFFDVSTCVPGSGAAVPMFGMGLAVGDYNLDGFLDLFITNIHNNVLLNNNGDGLTFTDATSEAGAGAGVVGGMDRVAWGTVFFDYDNDGDEDLYLVSGHLQGSEAPNPEEQPNVLLRNDLRGDLRNDGKGAFTDVSPASGADDPGIGRGGAFLDYNNDGCLDLFVANLRQKARLFENLCNSGNNWLVIRPVGAISNRDGIGARITVVAGGTTQTREVSAGASYMGQNMLEAHFGLGTAELADSVSIRWPSGRVQTLTNVTVNRRLIIVEPD